MIDIVQVYIESKNQMIFTVFVLLCCVFWNIIASNKRMKNICEGDEDLGKNSTIYDKNLAKNIFISWCPNPPCKDEK